MYTTSIIAPITTERVKKYMIKFKILMLVPAIAVLTACTNDTHADSSEIVKNVEYDEVNEENDATITQESVETQETEIYERFLTGELTIEKEEEQVYISELFWDNDIEYCFCDIDGDGSEELHMKDSAIYYIIKICDQSPQIILENWWGYEPVVTDELCGILYYSQGYGDEHIEFIRIRAEGSRESDGEFRWYDENKNGSMDEEDSFCIDYSKDIDMEQYIRYRDELLAKQAGNELEWTGRRLKDYVTWQEAYADFILKNYSMISVSEYTTAPYSLIYVDDDDIPELYINTGYSVGGEFVVSFYDGNVRAMNRYRGGIKYTEYGGLLYSDWGHMGLYPFNIYMLEKGEFSEIGTGWYSEYYDDESEDIYWEYFWEGKEVTEAEYEECINELIDTSQCIEPPMLYTKDEILDILADSDTK